MARWANGATSVIFESIPTYPDAGRYWDMVDRLGITILYTAPTAIRAIAREGDEHVKRYSRKCLRILGTRRRADQPRGLALVLQRGRARSVAPSSIPTGRRKPAAT